MYTTIVSYADRSQEDIVKTTPYKVLKHGEYLRLGGADIRCLGPIYYRKVNIAATKENANSLIFRMTYGAHSYLFTGDTSDSVLREVNAKYPGELRSDVFKNPHHNGPHKDDILELVQPSVTVFCAGNEDLPGSEYLRALKKRGCACYVTCSARDGNVLVTSDGQSLDVLCGYPMEKFSLNPVGVLSPGQTLRLTGTLEPASRAKPTGGCTGRAAIPAW